MTGRRRREDGQPHITGATGRRRAESAPSQRGYTGAVVRWYSVPQEKVIADAENEVRQLEAEYFAAKTQFGGPFAKMSVEGRLKPLKSGFHESIRQTTCCSDRARSPSSAEPTAQADSETPRPSPAGYRGGVSLLSWRIAEPMLATRSSRGPGIGCTATRCGRPRGQRLQPARP